MVITMGEEKPRIVFHREIPVRYEPDIFIAGGGPAGIAAAISAAREGAKVFLAEGQGCLGGLGTAGLVPAFMQFGDGVNFLAAGIGSEVLQRLRSAGGTDPNDHPDASTDKIIGIKAEILKRVYDEMMTEAGVDFALHTVLIGVETDNGCISAAICAAKSGIFAVRAKIYIDCTGDGDLAAWAGAPFEKGDEKGVLQPGTLCSLWANIDFDKWEKSGISHQAARLEQAYKDGVFSYLDRHLPGIWPISENIGGGNVGHVFGVDGTDEKSLTNALIEGRGLLIQYERYYKQYLPGFEKMELVATGSLMGIRETRRIIGEYILSLDDFRNRAVFDDEIGRYCFPVDIHPSSPDADDYEKYKHGWDNYRLKRGESYGIPFRCLVPQGLSNVLVAGRCISTDRYLQGSVRVIPGCYITGQAAGVAAAIAAENNTTTRDINIKEMQKRLIKIGAYLPNAKV